APLPRPFLPAEIRFGAPLYPSRWSGDADDRLLWRRIIDEVMYEIRALTGQDYVDTYATKGRPEATEALERTADPEMPRRRSSAEVLRSAV
ncbi:MAG: hypothetical protein D6683_14470, partial [Actinomyces sp.]